MKTFLFFLSLSFPLFSQVPENLRIRGSLRKLPLSLLVNPLFQVEKKRETTFYSHPIPMKNPSFYPAREENGWWEVKTKTRTIGLGLRIPIEMKPGLAIYKGSSQTSVRRVQDRGPANTPYIFPTKLDQASDWQTGDSSDSESYGGIVARMSFKIEGLPAVTAVVGIQNSFRLTMRKLEDRKVELVISEEKLTERVLKTSLEIVKLSFARMKNRKLSFRFIMDPELLSHQVLFQKALQGDLTKLQSTLESSHQKLSWIADQKKITLGVSLVRKDSWSWTDLSYPGSEDSIFMRSKKSKGKLSLNRSWVDYVLLEEKGITLHWTHQMKKMTQGRFRKFFLKSLVQLGISSDRLNMASGMNFGKVLTEISLHVGRDELLSLPEYKGKDWKAIRKKIAITLMNNPKTLPVLFPGKETRVKFWSDTLQSFEGNFSLGSKRPEAQ